MVKEHEIYMGEIILEVIKEELRDNEITWYKDHMTRLADETYRETSYYLTNRYLIESMTRAESLIIRKYDRNTIEKVEKEYSINRNNIILEKVTIFFKDDNSLYFKRPNQRDYGDIKGFERFFKQL